MSHDSCTWQDVKKSFLNILKHRDKYTKVWRKGNVLIEIIKILLFFLKFSSLCNYFLQHHIKVFFNRNILFYIIVIVIRESFFRIILNDKFLIICKTNQRKKDDLKFHREIFYFLKLKMSLISTTDFCVFLLSFHSF